MGITESKEGTEKEGAAWVTRDEIRVAVRTGVPMSWTLENPKHENLREFSRVLAFLLDELHRPDLKHSLVFGFHEMFTNGQKALAKRAFFDQKGLDIRNEQDYALGMLNFRKEWLENLEQWNHGIKEQGSCIQVVFHWSNGVICVVVANTGSLLPIEQSRIQTQLSETIATLANEPLECLDQTEGGGYGLRLIYSLLERMGCPPTAFQITSQNNRTIALYKIPLAKLSHGSSELSQQLAKEANDLPAFPETVILLQQKLGEPEMDISHLVPLVNHDPNLVAALLKLANSVTYRRGKPVSSVHEAITHIGLRGFSSLLWAFGSESVLREKYQQTPLFTSHALETAELALQLSRQFCPAEAEIAFAGGLLHDLGESIIATHQNRFHEIGMQLEKQGKIPSWLVEVLGFGLDHAELGGMVAEHWNFPPQLIDIIKNHHCPSKSPDPSMLSAIIHLADLAPKILDGSYPLYLLDPVIEEKLGLKTEEQIQATLHKHLKALNDKLAKTPH